MFTTWLNHASLAEAAIFFIVVNVLLVLASAGSWYLIRWTMRSQLLIPAARCIGPSDLQLTTAAIAMNVLISCIGWAGWKRGWVPLASPSMSGTMITWGAMVIVMDLGMYLTHRLAHHRSIYPWLHRQHHDHVETNSLSLFVLNPIEVTGFGTLLLAGILIVRPTEAALVLYLSTNVIFGTIGHAGIRIIRAQENRSPQWAAWDTSRFHATHHHLPGCNYGFYTPIWDWLLGTYGDSFPHCGE